MKYILTLIFIFSFSFAAFGQSETLTNSDVILMTKAGLNKVLIVRKIGDSNGRYDVTAQGLIELKKSGVADDVIALMLERKSANVENSQTSSGSQSFAAQSNSNTHIVLDSKVALRSAKTIAVEKSSINPSRQALEKELLKRKDWRQLNLNIVRYKTDADLYIEIGFVPFSVVTHRYVFRIYDRKSGTVIAAGETTSWGSLAENLARKISKELVKVL